MKGHIQLNSCEYIRIMPSSGWITDLFYARMKRDPTAPAPGPHLEQHAGFEKEPIDFFRPVVSARIRTSAAKSRTAGPRSSRVYALVLLPFDTSRWLSCTNIVDPTTVRTSPLP